MKGAMLNHHNVENSASNSSEMKSSFNPDRRIEKPGVERFIKSVFHFERKVLNDIESETSLEDKDVIYSSYDERLGHTPSENSTLGVWNGIRGESKFIPSEKTIQTALNEFGVDGIEYKDAIPDFSKCSIANVKIKMTSERISGGYGESRTIGNYEKADTECAKKWNSENHGGRNDWQARDVKQWRENNNYTWHECNDMKTCQLIPTSIHGVCKHLGGVSECIRRDSMSKDGGYDD